MKTILLILLSLSLYSQTGNPVWYPVSTAGISWVAINLTNDIYPEHPGLSTAVGFTISLVSGIILSRTSWSNATQNEKMLLPYGAVMGGLTARCWLDFKSKYWIVIRKDQMRYSLKGSDYYER